MPRVATSVKMRKPTRTVRSDTKNKLEGNQKIKYKDNMKEGRPLSSRGRPRE